MNKVKSFYAKGKKKALALIFAAFMAVSTMSVCSSAADSSSSGSALSGAGDQILEQFKGAADDILPIIIGILGAGLTIFIVFIGIRLGKKMFTTVAK